MIERLSGKLQQVLPGGIILDVNGVGYGVDMPLTALCDLPGTDMPLTVWTYTYVREDALKLFGFLTYEERYFFQVLVSLSGIGPKTALNILSHLSVSAITTALLQGNAGVFEMVPGIGNRLAEKILLELKPKLKRLTALPQVQAVKNKAAVPKGLFDAGASLAEPNKFVDLRSALENLGYKDKQIEPLLQKIARENGDEDFATLVKVALAELSGMNASSAIPTAELTADTDLF